MDHTYITCSSLLYDVITVACTEYGLLLFAHRQMCVRVRMRSVCQ